MERPPKEQLLISWPSFQTAEGDVVAAGNLSVTLNPSGAFTAQLVPNVDASRWRALSTSWCCNWMMERSEPNAWADYHNFADNYFCCVSYAGNGTGVAATQQYVNSAVAGLAVTAATVVHLAWEPRRLGNQAVCGASIIPNARGND